MLLVADDLIYRRGRFFGRLHGEQSFTVGPMQTETGILQDDRPATGQVGSPAVAQPAAARGYTGMFGDAEVGPGIFDKSMICFQGAGHLQRIDQLPSMLAQAFLVSIPTQGQMKGAAHPSRQVDEMFQFSTFAAVRSTFEDNLYRAQGLYQSWAALSSGAALQWLDHLSSRC
jgi:hypothetical protein